MYLPQSADWFDFWTGKRFKGGQTVKADAPLDKIPLFVRAGAILPMGKAIQYTGEKSADTLEIRVYKGADAEFVLYEDEGDNYNYEKGQYSLISFKWNEKALSLTIGDKQGDFRGSLKKRVFNVVLVDEDRGNRVEKEVLYVGKRVKLRL